MTLLMKRCSIKMVKDIENKIGTVDILINNAGILNVFQCMKCQQQILEKLLTLI